MYHVIVLAISDGAQIATRHRDAHPATPWSIDEYPAAAGIEVLYVDPDGHLITVAVAPDGVLASAPDQAAPLDVTAVVENEQFAGLKVEFTTCAVTALPISTAAALPALPDDIETGDPL